MQLRPRLCDVLGRIVEPGHKIAMWSNETHQREIIWMETIFGKELKDKFLFTWFANQSTGM